MSAFSNESGRRLRSMDITRVPPDRQARWIFTGLAGLIRLNAHRQVLLGGMVDGSQRYFVVDLPCQADINCSGSLSVQDIFDFLAAYFGGCA